MFSCEKCESLADMKTCLSGASEVEIRELKMREWLPPAPPIPFPSSDDHFTEPEAVEEIPENEEQPSEPAPKTQSHHIHTEL